MHFSPLILLLLLISRCCAAGNFIDNDLLDDLGDTSLLDPVVVQPDGIDLIHDNLDNVYEGDPVELTCERNYSIGVTIHWRWRPIDPQSNNELLEIDHTNNTPPGAKISNEAKLNNGYEEAIVTKLRWDSIPADASGTYFCYDSILHDVNKSVILSVQKWNARSFKKLSILKYNAKDNFSVDCAADGALWEIPPPKSYDTTFYYSNGLVKPLLERSNVIGSKLHVYDASYLDTGLYTCRHGPNDGLDGDGIIRQVYVFVTDYNTLILPPTLRKFANDVRVLTYFSAQDVLIGCAPTHPDVEVVMKKETDKDNKKEYIVVANSSLVDDNADSEWSYDRYEGFRLKKITTWELKGHHECEYTLKKDGAIIRNSTQPFKIKIIGLETVVYEEDPDIYESRTPIYEGQPLMIGCRTKNKKDLKMKWIWSRGDGGNQTISQGNEPPGMRRFNQASREFKPKDKEIGSFREGLLQWDHILVNASGLYICLDESHPNAPPGIVNITVLKSRAPKFIDDVDETHEVERYGELTFTCQDEAALPEPKIKWFVLRTSSNKDTREEEIKAEIGKKFYTIQSNESFSELIIRRANESAMYKCRFENWGGSAEKRFHVVVRGLPTGIIIAIIFLVIIILVLAFFVTRAFHRQKMAYKHLLNNRLRLLEGNLDQINPDLPLDQQIDLLPYDTKWEFPLNHLVLGKQLGAGQFGRVVQARAVVGGTTSKTVAVKMVKSQTDNDALTSLACELKVLMHIGSHENVVNLLGAVTNNIIKGDLLVMLEFCRNGNLQDFLKANRRHYVDQLDNYGNLRSLDSTANDNYTDLTNKQDELHPVSKSTEQNINVETGNESHGSKFGRYRYWIAEQTGKVIPSKERAPEIEEKRSPVVTTRDLVEWSFQIACGMNYLSKRKVLHGDLAARNVLLGDENIVKIGDFGLSRKIYQNPNYQKQGQEALPVKWMAIESLIDRTFSSQSDVWSYGITLWEIFTLSKTPYPDVEDLAEHIRNLKRGQRLEKPDFAPNIVGDLMASCWRENPEERITFAQLEQMLGEIVEPEIRSRFAGADEETYSTMNSQIDNTKSELNTQTNPGYMKMTSLEEKSEPGPSYMNLSNIKAQLSKSDRVKLLKKQGLSAFSLPVQRPPFTKSLSLSSGDEYLAMTPVTPSNIGMSSFDDTICEELLEIPIEDVGTMV